MYKFHKTASLPVWPAATGPFPLTLAYVGKEWPSFLWTRHCVRSPGSGSPFHFMVHRPLRVIMPFFQVQRRKCFVKLMSLSAPCGSPFSSPSMSPHWLVNYHSRVKSGAAPLSSSLVLAANEELHMLQGWCSPGLICIGWMDIRLFNVKAKLVNICCINIWHARARTLTPLRKRWS